MDSSPPRTPHIRPASTSHHLHLYSASSATHCTALAQAATTSGLEDKNGLPQMIHSNEKKIF